MKYEIITDSNDLLVLVINSRVVAVSSDMSKIMEILTDDYNKTRNKIRRDYNPALIHPELDTYEEIKPTKGHKPALEGHPLGSLFTI